MGPGRSGKDTASDYIQAHTSLRYSGTTSTIISRRIAEERGVTFEEAHAVRHAERDLWRAKGDEMRAHDPAALARVVLREGDILTGVRARCEMQAVRDEGLVDLVLWIDRPGIPEDPTQEFGPELCDAIVPNWWGIPEFHGRLERLLRAFGIDWIKP